MPEYINKTKNQRIIYLDILRGLMLVLMTFDHLGGPIKNITFQPLGFVSAAAGFIYLSGFVYGLVYTRAYLNSDYKALKIKSTKRAGVIYFYHILVLFIVIVPVIINLYDFRELHMFKEHPTRSVLLFAIFLLQPYNMDILPMYVIFILTGPLVIRALTAGHAKMVFILSGSLWFISQWNIFQFNSFDLDQYGLHLGYFNIFCWQFLFFLGILFGYNKVSGKFALPLTKGMVLLTSLALLVFMAVRYSSHEGFFYRLFSYFSERRTLGIARLINFGLVAYLIYALTQKYEHLSKSGWLSFLGRHSLQVFAYSVILIYFFLPLKYIINSYGIWGEILFDIILVASLSIPALIHQIAVYRLPVVRRLGL